MLRSTLRLFHLSLFILTPFTLMLSGSSFAAANPNIILITLGSVRAHRVGFLDAKHPTPALDGVAKQSIVFEHAYAQAPLTVVSDASILSGAYPQTHGATEFGSPLAAGVAWLPEVLHGRGYKRVAFVGTSMLDPKSGYAPGFDRGFDSYDSIGGTKQIADIVAWVSGQHETPFFLWANIAPRAGAATGNAAVARIVEALRRRKLFDDSIIAIVSGHGESLGAPGEDPHGIFSSD